MNKDGIEGKWNQMRYEAKGRWAKLTDNPDRAANCWL
jgi:uncharacterized protein YjbJ (UPF0337 family)